MKTRLMTPGPVEIPPEVLLEMAQPIFHHRTERHKAMVAVAVERLREVFQTQNDIVILSSSGTGGMEAAVVNLVGPGEKMIAVNAGKFGERWVKLGQRYAAEVIEIRLEWGQSVEPQAIADALQEHPDAVAVFTTLSDTSSGAATDIEAIGSIVADTPAVLVVDGISSVGAMPMRTDAWRADVVIAGSQKALLTPPGLAVMAISDKAKQRILAQPARAFYFDLKAALSKAEDNDFPWTPGITLIRGLNKALERIVAEGMENVWARHERCARACRAGLKALGFEIFPDKPASPLTVARVPEEVDGAQLAKDLENLHGYKVAGGQEQYKGKLIRIAHMGAVDEGDLLGVLAAIEQCLRAYGLAVEPGAGVAAAQNVLAQS